MKISMLLGYSGGFDSQIRMVQDLEKAGLDLVFVAEAYGNDAPSMMGYLAAVTETVQIGSGILPIYTRTPTLIAQTAAGIDEMSNGRCVLGLGASGPQVIEGWHGVEYSAPIGRTREIIDVCRTVWRRERLDHHGRYYDMPLPEGRGTGLGKSLKLITHPKRSEIPIWVASLGPANVEMTAELADGWLPIFYLPERANEVWGDALAKGFAKRAPERGTLDISAGGMLAIGDDVDVEGTLSFGRSMAALYIGGMGAKGKNFYNSLFASYGYEAEAEKIQDLYLDGRKDEAAAAIPLDFLQAGNLVGPEGLVKERLAAYKEAGVTYLQVTPATADPVKAIEQLRTLVDDL